ncbi:MAG: DUF4331 domain-containing protein [Planctomycetota bacterium]|nr:DUF4331 domain-containing protein [Planctomycetota bacterium]
MRILSYCLGALAATSVLLPLAPASSHREAPNITKTPKVDATDFYMFRSYEAGRQGFVTLIADYIPLQDPYGGPNYFTMDQDALYEIHVDNDADAVEDITFQFKFQRDLQDKTLQIGDPGSEKTISVPLVNVGGIGPGAGDVANLNVRERYTVDVVFGDRRTGTRAAVQDARTNSATFVKPVDNIGTKSIPDYEGYANDHVVDIVLPDNGSGRTFSGRMFVGQRKDPFVVNLGEIFDLVNFVPLGDPSARTDDLADANVTALCLEIPIEYLVVNEPVIGGWTTASVRQARIANPNPLSAVANKVTVEGGAYTQVSRLAMPLVNEVVIGLKDKDRFNASEPMGDGQFADYVTNPSLPELLEILFFNAGVRAPNLFPRTDLVSVFLTGVQGVNQPVNVVASEMMRLNTTTAPAAAANQDRLGVLGGDLAGFPNGRRPGDDVVDLALRGVLGVLLDAKDAPSGALPFTDGAFLDATFFDTTFPYLRTPLPGAPSTN